MTAMNLAVVGIYMKQNWPGIDKFWRQVIDISGFVTLLSLILYTFEPFNNEELNRYIHLAVIDLELAV